MGGFAMAIYVPLLLYMNMNLTHLPGRQDLLPVAVHQNLTLPKRTLIRWVKLR